MSNPSSGNPALPPPPRNCFCGNCGSTVSPGAAVCLRCGFVPTALRNFCQNCGINVQPGQAVCTRCGFVIGGGGGGGQVGSGEKSKVAAGLLAIFLGGLGVHKFYLGYNTAGIILLATTLIGICLSIVVIGLFIVWIPGTIALIEGIIYLTKSDADFHNGYVVNRREWF